MSLTQNLIEKIEEKKFQIIFLAAIDYFENKEIQTLFFSLSSQSNMHRTDHNHIILSDQLDRQFQYIIYKFFPSPFSKFNIQIFSSHPDKLMKTLEISRFTDGGSINSF